MSKLELARSTLIEAQCQWRMFREVKKFLPNQPWSPAAFLDQRVVSEPNSLALLYLDQKYTFREVDRKANQYAHFFRNRGVGQGDVVALMMDNRPDFVFVLLGLSRLRAITSLINTNVTGVGLTHAINICKPKAVLFGDEHSEAISEVLSTLQGVDGKVWMHAEDGKASAPQGTERMNELFAKESDARPTGLRTPSTSDVMCYIYTSGTTGLPKAAIITNKRWIAAAFLFGGAMMDASPRDIIYASLPLYHSSAMFAGFGASLVTGAALAVRRKFSSSQFWDDVRKFDASIFVYIGELCRYLLNSPRHPNERNHRLRLGVGNGLRPDIWEPFQRRFGVPLIREFYGATEGNAPIVNFEGRPGMVGRLKPGQVIVRCDETSGEILRNSQGFCEQVGVGQKGILLGHINRLFSFEGYVDKTATSKKVVTDVFKPGDRYFNSHDLLQLHDHGWVSFADRIGDTFRWKGENVSTNEVAEVLNGAKGVLESNVYGVKVTGAEGRAGMASINIDGDLDLDQFARYVCDKLPAYQRPYFLRLQKDMRITGTFKHQKVDYRDEGYDPSKVGDPLYFLDGDRYVPIDGGLFQRLAAGEIGPR
jgi:acyl-CoA synthetase (AMP-forming)/AMP-acid ligase II